MKTQGLSTESVERLDRYQLSAGSFSETTFDHRLDIALMLETVGDNNHG